MKAIVCTRYGSPDVLRLADIPTPKPGDNEVLVRVHATSLNAVDFETLRGVFMVRVASPFRPPHRILGTDVAGTVEAVGAGTTSFGPGDSVWADLSEHGWGAFAEYACVAAAALRPKPASMTFGQAAAFPQAGVLALQNLRGIGSPASGPALWDKGRIEPGHSILVNGAGGGVGTFAVQTAKAFGAEVTAVDSGAKLDMLRSIGADHVIDYAKEDFTRADEAYDLVLDVVATRPARAYRRALRPGGVVVYVGGTTASLFKTLLAGLLVRWPEGRKLGVGRWKPNRTEDLDALAELYESGKVMPVIDRTCRLDEVPEALRCLEQGLVQGKIVVRVSDAPPGQSEESP